MFFSYFFLNLLIFKLNFNVDYGLLYEILINKKFNCSVNVIVAISSP